MIGFLRGEVLEVSDHSVVIGIASDSACTGYLVNVIDPALYQVGQKAQFFIHTHVREDALDLFGFESADLKKLFLTLTEVNRVGPKSALGILTKISFEDLVTHISLGNTEQLGKIQGIGKKTAERLVVELQDKMTKRFGPLAKAVSHAGAESTAHSAELTGATKALIEAKQALIGLGYREAQIASVLSSIVSEFKDQKLSTEQTIKAALRELSV